MGVDSIELTSGTAPLLLSMPHCGLELPAEVEAGMTALACSRLDTDWHVDRLYAFAGELGASLLRPRYSRYLVDLNRPPDDSSLYPGSAGTGLCPLTTFDGEPLYLSGREPDADERRRRREMVWQPYHDALQQELARLRDEHGAVVLFDAHSIRSRVPRLFDGTLPDLNLGTNAGASCAAGLRDRVAEVLSGADYSHVVDGRFKGGYITRAYGRPAQQVHAIQLEIAQTTYMKEDAPFSYLPQRAMALQALLMPLLLSVLDWTAAQ